MLVLAAEVDVKKLIFLQDENADKHFEWIKNYFTKKAEQEIKKAA